MTLAYSLNLIEVIVKNIKIFQGLMNEIVKDNIRKLLKKKTSLSV